MGKLAGFRSTSPQLKKRVVRFRMSHLFSDVPRFYFILICYTVCGDVIHCFEAAGENDVCDVCVYICMYMCTHTALDMYTLHVRSPFG